MDLPDRAIPQNDADEKADALLRLTNRKVYGHPESLTEQELEISPVVNILQAPESDLPSVIRATTDEIGRTLDDASPERAEIFWFCIVMLIIHAAQNTAEEAIHGRLVDFVFSLAWYGDTIRNGTGLELSKTAELMSDLYSFSWELGDLLKSPGPSAETELNLHRFAAHLSVQQRKTPVKPLENWLERFGIETIRDGIEDLSPRSVALAGKSAAAWIIIAGWDMYEDPGWGLLPDEEKMIHVGGCGVCCNERLHVEIARAKGWDLWKERVRQIAADARVDIATRKAMREAEEAMDRIEKEVEEDSVTMQGDDSEGEMEWDE